MKINSENAYRKFIKQNYKEKTQIIQTIEFNHNALRAESELGESNLNFNSFSTFIETNNYFYLNMLTSDKIIIPKHVKALFEHSHQLITTIESHHIEAFYFHLKTIISKRRKKPLSNSYIHTQLFAIRLFFAYLSAFQTAFQATCIQHRRILAIISTLKMKMNC